MRRSTLFLRVVSINAALVISLVVSAAADEVRRWRDAQGREHVTIVGEEGPAASAGQSDADARFSTDVSLRRRKIERALEAGTQRLAEKREEIREAEASTYAVHRLPTPEDEEERERVRDLTRNALLAANAFDDAKRRRLFFLRRAEREILFELSDLWHDLERLRDEVRAYYGRKPPWWIDKVRCEDCPTLEEIAVALEKNEVEVVTTADPTPSPTH